jgi:NAD(P) transhydrogenase
VHRGVTIIGYTDLPSRLPTQSSTLYSNNVTKFLLSMTPPNQSGRFYLDLEDEVVRGALVSHNGALLAPVPRAPVIAAAPPPTTKKDEKHETLALTPWQKATREVATVTAGMGSAVALGKLTGPLFMTNFFTFGLAGLIGYRVVWGVAPALHSPLMSVTNAISGQYFVFLSGEWGTDREDRYGGVGRPVPDGRRVLPWNHPPGLRSTFSAHG